MSIFSGVLIIFFIGAAFSYLIFYCFSSSISEK